jgi:hypothetical protein
VISHVVLSSKLWWGFIKNVLKIIPTFPGFWHFPFQNVATTIISIIIRNAFVCKPPKWMATFLERAHSCWLYHSASFSLEVSQPNRLVYLVQTSHKLLWKCIHHESTIIILNRARGGEGKNFIFLVFHNLYKCQNRKINIISNKYQILYNHLRLPMYIFSAMTTTLAYNNESTNIC